jgi:hypothetical protein
MGSIRHSILQSKIHELHESRERLTKRLAVLQPARERETRPEEQLRLDHFVAETQAARQQVETELLQLEDELNGLLASPLAGGQGHVPAAPGVTPPTRRLTPGPITVFYSYSHKDEAHSSEFSGGACHRSSKAARREDESREMLGVTSKLR